MGSGAENASQVTVTKRDPDGIRTRGRSGPRRSDHSDLARSSTVARMTRASSSVSTGANLRPLGSVRAAGSCPHARSPPHEQRAREPDMLRRHVRHGARRRQAERGQPQAVGEGHVPRIGRGALRLRVPCAHPHASLYPRPLADAAAWHDPRHRVPCVRRARRVPASGQGAQGARGSAVRRDVAAELRDVRAAAIAQRFPRSRALPCAAPRPRPPRFSGARKRSGLPRCGACASRVGLAVDHHDRRRRASRDAASRPCTGCTTRRRYAGRAGSSWRARRAEVVREPGDAAGKATRLQGHATDGEVDHWVQTLCGRGKVDTMRKSELAGMKFGRLEVLSPAPSRGGRGAWNCCCDCGALRVVLACNLGRNTVSCGCHARDVVRARRTTHGLSRTRTFSTWAAMKSRCMRTKDKDWAAYGGRGVTVCRRWMKFENFLADMGERPAGMSIDRIDNDILKDGYSKDNCRWATFKQQSVNRRNVTRAS